MSTIQPPFSKQLTYARSIAGYKTGNLPRESHIVFHIILMNKERKVFSFKVVHKGMIFHFSNVSFFANWIRSECYQIKTFLIKNYFVLHVALVHMITKSSMTWKEILPWSTPLCANDFSTLTKVRPSETIWQKIRHCL